MLNIKMVPDIYLLNINWSFAFGQPFVKKIPLEIELNSLIKRTKSGIVGIMNLTVLSKTIDSL